MGGAPAAEAVAGVAAIAGHVFPVWLAFSGGKGVATTLGACAAWSPAAAAVAAGIFLAVVMTLRLVSLGSLLAAVAAGPTAYALGAPRPVVVALFAAAALIVVRHRDNIMRLAAGTERRIGGFGRDRTSR
jgi:glycerol-3-phosphate acyltransferase PlsY